MLWKARGSPGERQSALTRPLVAALSLVCANTSAVMLSSLVLSLGELVSRGQCEDVDVGRAPTAPKGRVDGDTGARQGHTELVTLGQALVSRLAQSSEHMPLLVMVVTSASGCHI